MGRGGADSSRPPASVFSPECVAGRRGPGLGGIGVIFEQMLQGVMGSWEVQEAAVGLQ